MTPLLVAVVGVATAITVAWISHSTKISEFRQAWINALRDDLVVYFKELETLNFLVGEILRPSNADKTTELEQKSRMREMHCCLPTEG
jgi:hypothetical protein